MKRLLLAFGAFTLAGLACVGWAPSVPAVAVQPSVPGPSQTDASEADSSDAAPWVGLESSIGDAVEDAMGNQKVPGAVVIIGRDDRVLFRHAYGFRQLQPDRAPMTVDTLFDLASLTKPIATATSVMVLAERGALGLDDALAKYVPECAGGDKRTITIRHLLLH